MVLLKKMRRHFKKSLVQVKLISHDVNDFYKQFQINFKDGSKQKIFKEFYEPN